MSSDSDAVVPGSGDRAVASALERAKITAARNIPAFDDLPITADMCQEVGGILLPATQWMVHVWSVPGYDNVDGGVFAEVNPALACSDGTYFRLDPTEWAQNLTNVCQSKAPGEPRYPL